MRQSKVFLFSQPFLQPLFKYLLLLLNFYKNVLVTLSCNKSCGHPFKKITKKKKTLFFFLSLNAGG